MAAEVVKLARETEQVVDTIFFPKHAIKIGTVLINHGRRDPGSEWVVADIRTYVRRPSGKYALQHSDTVVHLNDLVTVRRQQHDPAFINKREPTFGSLSYSAIWRLKA